MAFVTVEELSSTYNKDYLVGIEIYYKKLLSYLEKAIIRENKEQENSIVVAMFNDSRISTKVLYSDSDATSPLVDFDYGLLANLEYSVPADISRAVQEKADLFIAGLTSSGFDVVKFQAYTRGFDIIDEGSTYEGFFPVMCYRISWLNSRE